MSDIEIDLDLELERNYAAEDAYITSYPEVLENTKAESILEKWNVSILERGLERGLDGNLLISEELNPEKMFILPARHTDALRMLRYGVVNSEIINKDASLVVENMEETIRQRVEYGGHINVDTQEITLKYKGINGAIEEYDFLKDKINYHTHPSLINKWGFSPPSETDLKTTVTESHRLNKRIVSLVAAAEGIYVYYLTKELFDFFNTDEGHSKIGSIDEDYFKDLKLLLGYVMSGPARQLRLNRRPGINRRLRGETSDSNPSPLKRGRSLFDSDSDSDSDDDLDIGRTLFGGAAVSLSPPRTIRHVGVTLINRKITIGKFLDTIRNMGFFIKLYEYGVDLAIPIPNDIVTTDVMPGVTSIGGSKIYKINFTKL